MNRCEVGIGRDSCRFLAPLTVFLPALFLASFTISDPDTFFHLTFGKIIVASGLPTTNTVSFTWGSYPWKNTEWLFGVILYLLHSLGGEVAISAFQALVVAAAFSLTADTVRRRLPGLSPVVWLVMLPLFLAALAASQFRFVPRPQLVSFLGLSLLLNLWERRPRRLPLWFGLTGCAWANLHPGVIFGLAVCLALVVSSARSRERFGPAVCAGVAFFAGTLVNPYFFHPYVYAASHLFISERVSLVEFAQPTLAQNGTFFVLAALAVLAIPQRWRRGDVLHPLLVAGFLALSLYVVRFVPKFLLLALPGLCQTAAELVSTPERSRRRIAALALFALGVCLLLFAGRDVFFRTHHDPFGWGLNERRIPAGAADFISSRSLRGRMYNDFQQGGYLM
ncbi:MAG TPA: hypothetical protein VN317_10710, partial [Candidatus Methanoperedens sp.]|nr:hypothetical protein [Candidatus Methanoperedens sp.]